MKPDAFFYLGKILKRHGNRGHLLVILDVDEIENYSKLESVYVDMGHERIPFFIESIDLLEKNRVILKLADVEATDHADAFTGREIYLPLSMLPKLDGNRFYYHEVKGFNVVDEKHGEIGTIQDVLELPHQAMFMILYGDKEILIPIVDEVIQSIDRKKKKIHISAPEGLIDIYHTTS